MGCELQGGKRRGEGRGGTLKKSKRVGAAGEEQQGGQRRVGKADRLPVRPHSPHKRLCFPASLVHQEQNQLVEMASVWLKALAGAVPPTAHLLVASENPRLQPRGEGGKRGEGRRERVCVWGG